MRWMIGIVLSLCVVVSQAALLDVLSSFNVTLPAKVAVNNNYLFRSTGFSTSATQPLPIYFGVTSDGGYKLAWTGDDAKVHVSTFGSDNSLTNDFTITATNVRGFFVHSDGSYAIMLWDANKLDIAKYTSGNSQQWRSNLETSRAPSTNWNLGDGRLTFGYHGPSKGERYAAYYKVHGTADSCFPGSDGHEGDSYKLIAADGTVANGWCWGCSHGMAQLASFNNNGTLMLLCVTDCYPSPPGVYMQNSVKVIDISGDCKGGYQGEIGSLVPFGTNQWLYTMTAKQSGSSNYDVAVAIASSTGSGSLKVDKVVWVTDTNENEVWAYITPFAGNYLISWVREVNGDRRVYLSTINSNGDLISDVEDATGRTWYGERNGFVTLSNGDALWAYPVCSANGAYYTATNTLTITRVGNGNYSPSTAAVVAPWLTLVVTVMMACWMW